MKGEVRFFEMSSRLTVSQEHYLTLQWKGGIEIFLIGSRPNYHEYYREIFLVGSRPTLGEYF